MPWFWYGEINKRIQAFPFCQLLFDSRLIIKILNKVSDSLNVTKGVQASG